MEFINRHFQTNGYIEVKLNTETIDYLWKIIKRGLKNKLSHKNNLAGNISKSYLLNDDNNFFYKKICEPLINIYRQNNNNGLDPTCTNSILDNVPFILKNIWVNYQYQTEFNPYHDHGGVYSFAIWMKIPYDSDQLALLPQFKEIEPSQRKAGKFEFEYLDTLGEIKVLSYDLSQLYEGRMVFFPSKLRHCVYPFYGTDEPRISISGNIWYDPSLVATNKAKKGFAS